MEPAVVECCIGPLEITTGVKKIAIGKDAIDEEAVFDDESPPTKFRFFVFFHIASLFLNYSRLGTRNSLNFLSLTLGVIQKYSEATSVPNPS